MCVQVILVIVKRPKSKDKYFQYTRIYIIPLICSKNIKGRNRKLDMQNKLFVKGNLFSCYDRNKEGGIIEVTPN